MATRPVIGVTGPGGGVPWAWWSIRWRLRQLSVASCYLTPAYGFPGREFDAFIISGGNDIDPGIYGGDMSASPSVDPQRDEFELHILDVARRRRLPVLGICRGMQLMNVHAMGSLVSDLKPYRVRTSNNGTLLPRKKITVKQESMLHRWLESDSVRVNSLHHQAINVVGKGLKVSSRDADGIIQSIESTGGVPRLGVQWHPEYMPQRLEQRRIFESFVAVCRRETCASREPDAAVYES